MAPRLELYAFRYRDLLTRKWIRARYRAELHEIKQRYAKFEVTGPPEIRDVDPDGRYLASRKMQRVRLPSRPERS